MVHPRRSPIYLRPVIFRNKGLQTICRQGRGYHAWFLMQHPSGVRTGAAVGQDDPVWVLLQLRAIRPAYLDLAVGGVANELVSAFVVCALPLLDFTDLQ